MEFNKKRLGEYVLEMLTEGIESRMKTTSPT
jgi:hypothetical protein